MNHEKISAISVFRVKFTLEFTSLTMNFSRTAWEEQAHPQRANGEGKKLFQSQLPIASE